MYKSHTCTGCQVYPSIIKKELGIVLLGKFSMYMYNYTSLWVIHDTHYCKGDITPTIENVIKVKILD